MIVEVIADDPERRSDCPLRQMWEKIIIPNNWFDGDSYSIGEFGMGARIQHDFYCEVECDNCGNQMSIMIHGYEYPMTGTEFG